MLEVINLTCVRGTRLLLRNLNFTATAGELIELRGPNGSGKTSLLRILCGLSAPAAGEVRWNGENIRSLGEEYFGVVASTSCLGNGMPVSLHCLIGVSLRAKRSNLMPSVLSGGRLFRRPAGSSQ